MTTPPLPALLAEARELSERLDSEKPYFDRGMDEDRARTLLPLLVERLEAVGERLRNHTLFCPCNDSAYNPCSVCQGDHRALEGVSDV